MRRKYVIALALATSAAGAVPSISTAALAPYSSLVTADNPKVYLQLDETTGTTATDGGSNAVSGTYGTGANITHETAVVSGSSPVLVGSIRNTLLDTAAPMVAVNLGTGTNSPSSIGTGSFSVEFWFKSLAVDDRQDLMDMNGGSGGTGSDFGIHLLGNNGTSSTTTQLRVFHTVTGSDPIPQSAATTVSQNVWHYLVYTRDAANSNVATLYLDGTSFATGTDTQTFTSTTPALALGQKTSGNTRAFVGNIDEFAIYGTALTPTDVSAHYLAGVPEPTTLALFGVAAAGLLVRRRRARAV